MFAHLTQAKGHDTNSYATKVQGVVFGEGGKRIKRGENARSKGRELNSELSFAEIRKTSFITLKHGIRN